MVNHKPQWVAPWYADAGDFTLLHRYMKDDFIESFQKESAQGLLKANAAQTWLAEDKFGGTHTRLRLPVHRTFYVVVSELVCDVPFKPAFSPRNIISAGFVVRKKNADKTQIWQMRDGAAIGWKDINQLDEVQDADHSKRKSFHSILRLQSSQTQNRSTGFTGEQTYPLHTHVVNASNKFHTLIYGYLPLSGSIDAQEVSVEMTVSSNPEVSAAGYLAELEWPFGSWDGEKMDAPVCDCTGSMQDLVKKLCDHFVWSAPVQSQIEAGSPKRAMANWLVMLINRYQIFDSNLSDNASLRNLLQSIPLLSRALTLDELDQMNNQPADFANWITQHNLQQGNLWSYVNSHYNNIMDWYTAEDKLYINNSIKPAKWNSLPDLSAYVYLTKKQAEDIRLAMLLRAEKSSQLIEAELPLPRYTQGKDERYFIVPFVRYRDDCGCEQLQWGKASMEFTVANPFDPLATRPTVIQLPELSDITKGFPKGVTFLTPKSVADLMMKVAPTMDMKPNAAKSPLSACMGFSISFSIPIITICAMILLMIVLNLLNIIFRWIPYAIMVLPRLCGKSLNPSP